MLHVLDWSVAKGHQNISGGYEARTCKDFTLKMNGNRECTKGLKNTYIRLSECSRTRKNACK